MFSAADIITLYTLASRYNYGINHEAPGSMLHSFVFMVATTNRTYALKIDSTLFFAFMSNILANPDYKKTFIKELDLLQNNSATSASASDFEKDFINFINGKNLGISLYKADQTFTNWNKLTINPSNPNQVLPTPCN